MTNHFFKMLKTKTISHGLPFLFKNFNFFSILRSILPVKWIFKTEKNNEAIFSSGAVLGQEIKLSKEEVEMVMSGLGIFRDSKRDNVLFDQVGGEEILELFDEEEPSLEELKEAFGVFDDNKDGFIDASELGKVLRSLGLAKEDQDGTHDEWLKMMIRAVDENQDGVLDFDEFLKFMEGSCFF